MANGFKHGTGWFNYLLKSGLSVEQSDYVINRISNRVRQRGDVNCCDNFRISVNGTQDKLYEELRDHGCCGFHDETITLNDGTEVKFGFNYGH